MQNFRLQGLDPALFGHLFELDDAALGLRGIRRVRAVENEGYPCRVSLEEAGAGEELLLLPFEHQGACSPYRSSGPIYVRRGAGQAVLAPGEVPGCVTRRQISLRAYDAEHMIIDADVVDGSQVAATLGSYFSASAVAYVHLHNAKRGCYSCLALRA